MFLSRKDVILVATDFSEAAQLALDAAAELAGLVGASMEILHVGVESPIVITPPDSVIPVPVDLSATIAADTALLQSAVASVRERGVSCTCSTTTGRPEAEIVERASTIGAELIVLGTHEHSGISRLLVGSVAELVLRHAPCPVLVVPAVSQVATKPLSDPLTELGSLEAQLLPA